MTTSNPTQENIRGVFADLDDGGLTEDEALMQIRKLVGAKQTIERIVLSGTLPFTITVDLTDGQVTEFEIDPIGVTFHDTIETRSGGEALDSELYETEIAQAHRIAEDRGAWPAAVPM